MESAYDRIIRLSDLPPGRSARVHKYEGSGLELILMEMGCVPGAAVRMVRAAPFGDPISISVAGYVLALRLQDASTIWVALQSP